MKKILGVAVAMTAFTATAEAHPGDHSFSALSSLMHLLTEPDHLAMMAGAIALAVGLYVRSRKRA